MPSKPGGFLFGSSFESFSVMLYMLMKPASGGRDTFVLRAHTVVMSRVKTDE